METPRWTAAEGKLCRKNHGFLQGVIDGKILALLWFLCNHSQEWWQIVANGVTHRPPNIFPLKDIVIVPAIDFGFVFLWICPVVAG